ncbi:LytTR family DNA-binding domain-containing protein [uncultured Polaribacter sp.]|uniref:LytR/AlgR family response regulator transcription factor n=1 Tax=uncultured Polaribacter sp. TaxID=174711 RepID=UPI00263265E4|nr:LytTR family DNA-binding domain-containing protein [uncultured Polaribacter sp.]
MHNLYTTLIIDDEAPARAGLQNLLLEFPETFHVLGTAQNAFEAKEKIETLQPDLIFLDIEMPECSGFELLAKLDKIPIVVFCTAYNQYALEAFETNSIDYIVKPVKKERIAKTVKKLAAVQKNTSQKEILSVLKDIANKKEVQKMTSITVKKNDRLIFIKLADVSHFEADNTYTKIYTASGVYLSNETVSSLAQKLPDNFLRIHRGIIINKEFVNDIQKYFNSRYNITLNNKKQSSVTSGRSYNEVIKSWINN